MHRANWQKIIGRIKALPPPQSPPHPRGPPSTTRTQRLRRRRKLGLRAFTVLASEEALDALVKLEFLNQDDRNSRPDVQIALARFLYRQLVECYEHTPWAKAAREQRLAARSRGRQQPPTQPPNQPPIPTKLPPEVRPQSHFRLIPRPWACHCARPARWTKPLLAPRP